MITPPVSTNLAWRSGKSAPLQTLDTLLHAGMQLFPDKTAVIYHTGELSYKELHSHANAIAVGLVERGVAQGDRVGVLLKRDAQLVPSLLAILKIGAAYVPLDSSFPVSRLEATLAHAQVNCLIVSPELAAPLHSGSSDAPTKFDPATVLSTPQAPHDGAGRPHSHGSVSDSLAANLIYTSGTTGTPKGVCVSRAAMANLLVALQDTPELSAHDRVLALSTIAFDIHVLELLAPLATGATIVLADDDAITQPSALLQLIEQHQVTLVQATPSMWGVLIGAGLPELPFTRGVAGGERLAPSIAVELRRRLHRCWNMYGPTEAAVYTTAKLLKPNSKVSIGTPLTNISIAVLQIGSQTGAKSGARTLAKIGELGELAIAGNGLADGYWQNQTATEERFVTLTIDNQSVRAYLSGDLAFVDQDGDVHCEGRIDQQIKLRGHRIELTEIEHTLLSHPQLTQVACSVHSFAQDDNRLVAYHTNPSLDARELREFVALRLPPYMVPQRFTYLPQLPRLASGKLDRQSLPRPSMKIETTRHPSATNISADHRALVACWQALLGGAMPEATHNFMDQGGHSLLAWRLVQNIEEQTGKVLPVRLVILDNFNALVAHLENQARQLNREETMPNARITPKPLSLIDTGLIAGAGKAIMQLYGHPKLNSLGYLIGNFDYGGRISTEFNDTVAAQGYNLKLFSQRFGLDPAPIWQVLSTMREGGYNVIETHGYKGHIIGYYCSRFAGIPWVAVAHGWTAENWKIKIYNALERFLLKRADAAVAVSPPLYETLKMLRGEDNTHLVFNAIDLQVPASRIPTTQTLTLGVIGRFSPEKGQDVMLDALPAVLAANPQVHLRIIGDGQERPALEAQAEALGISEAVTFTGWRSDMPEQYAQLDALILSSRSEGLPFAVLEAMAYGLPVIATRVGAIDHVITDQQTGWIVAPGDAVALARGINDALGNLDRLRQVGMAGRDSLHPKFSPDARADAMYELYRQLVNQTTR